MYKCKTYITCEDGKFIKGAVYNRLPNDSKYHAHFEEVVERKEVEINEETVETASLKPKKKRGRPKK